MTPKANKSLSPSGNTYDKYNSKNPLFRFLIGRFLKNLKDACFLAGTASNVLEVGCGEGYLLNYISNLKKFSRVEGIDRSAEIINKAKSLYPELSFAQKSVYSLDFRDNEFDLVLACEVLEHLEDYKKALAEIKRVTSQYVIVSVPVEPMWRIFNMLRGSYIMSFGNTPGHVQHWNTQSFSLILRQYFVVEKLWYPYPWQMALCKKS
ncbi:MAG: class I SAM-dependent methyltransferase [Candidatus Omnitrophota bacterium]